MKDSLQMEASVKALREQLSDGAPTATRRRVLTTLTRLRQRRRRAIQVLFFVATFLCGSTAAAWFTGDLPRLLERVVAAFSYSEVEHPQQRKVNRKKSAVPNGTSEKLVAQKISDDEKRMPNTSKRNPANTKKDVDRSAHDTKVKSTSKATGSKRIEKDEGNSPTQKPPRLTAEQEQKLYQYAHQKHFVDKDAEAALKAWDAYLQQAPQGQLHLEARYNRAIALVRIGNLREAARALQPFAYGEYGDYRRKEAGRLLIRIHTRLMEGE